MAEMVNGIIPREIEPDETIAGCVDIYYNIWPNHKETIQGIESEINKPGSEMFWSRAETAGSGKNQNARTNYDINITRYAIENNNLVAQNIHNQMYLTLLCTTIPYARKHSVYQLFHESYNMLKYSSGEGYTPHCDAGPGDNRKISSLVYLNNDFTGGELEFINFDIKIKPEPGMMLLFPSDFSYSHIAHTVTSGTKYAIVTWIRDY